MTPNPGRGCPLDWQEAATEGPDWYHTSGSEADWHQLTDIEHHAVPVSEDVTALLARLRSRL
ncbi:hypothetical protein ACFYPA_29120 [Streptomyces sp. NPDC005775]|uniref:hypothetical protein n=1 Tax=Streptomyces sp. NPDC005775 TaxID=3364729 RepID=UPI0036C5EACD